MTTGVGSPHKSLTTTFTPPRTCTDSTAYAGIWPDSTGSDRPILQATYPQSSNCFAPGWTSANNVYAKGANIWSGSPMCPNGQTVAQTVSSSTWTTAICCSSGWGDVYSNTNFDGSTSFSFYMCQTSWSTPATTTVFGGVISGGIVTPTTATVTGPGVIESTAEYLFLYNSLTPSVTRTSMVQSTMPITASSTVKGTTASSTSTSVPPPSSKSLSGGAIAGICLGVSLILLLACLGSFCVWKRRRSTKPLGQNDVPYGEKPELHGYSKQQIAEMQAGELPGAAARHARHYNGKPAELYVHPVELGNPDVIHR